MSRAWRYWRTVDAPPPTWISSPPAASRARRSASSSAGDEMKDGPAFHRDRFARVVRQHEHRHVIRRVLAPPAPPPVVGPRPAHGAEHVSAHDIRTDAFPQAFGKLVVGTRRPARFSVYLVKRAGAHVPAVPPLSTHTEWVLQSLAGAGAVPVERDREVVDAQFGHRILG